MTMQGNTSLINREFIGVVLPDKDPIHQGKYKVNVPEIQPHMKDTEGIWCKNHTCRHRITPSADGIYGSYYPLHAGISVIVKFFANHIESAYIDRIISDAYAETLPYEIIERDDYYQILRTPKHNNLIAIYESDTNSKNVPKNSIHVYYNDTRTTVVIDEDGINVKTADNTNVIITKKSKTHVKETVDVHIVGDAKVLCDAKADIHVKGDTKILCDSNTHIKTGTTTFIEAGTNVNVKGGTNVNVQGGTTVNVKGGTSVNIGAPSISLKGAAIMLEGAINLKGAVKSSFLHEGDAVKASAGPASATDAGSAAAASDAADAVDADEPTLIEPRQDYEYFTRKTGK